MIEYRVHHLSEFTKPEYVMVIKQLAAWANVLEKMTTNTDVKEKLYYFIIQQPQQLPTIYREAGQVTYSQHALIEFRQLFKTMDDDTFISHVLIPCMNDVTDDLDQWFILLMYNGEDVELSTLAVDSIDNVLFALSHSPLPIRVEDDDSLAKVRAKLENYQVVEFADSGLLGTVDNCIKYLAGEEV